MADDQDPWDPDTYAPSAPSPPPPQPMDQTPPGTTSQVGLGENDPLRDWSRNLTPDQFKQFQALHAQGDPEGAKQAMIDAGIGPPNGHYTGDGRGGVVPLTRAVTEPSPTQVTPSSSDQTPANMTGGPFGVGPPKGPLAGAVNAMPTPVDVKARIQNAFPNYGQQPPPTQPRPQPTPTPAPAQAPAPAPAPAAPKPKEQKIKMDDGSEITIKHGKGSAGSDLEPPETGQVPTPKPDPRKALAGKEKTRLEEGLDAASEAGKQFQGVKAPPRPELPKIGAPGVRSPVSVNPAAVNQLLGLVGQAQNPVQARLMQLLGRAV